MKITHEEYLKRVLQSKKIELEELKINHRIQLAIHETKEKYLMRQIDSIESQLDKIDT